MDGKTCGSTGNLSRHLKSHIDKIDPSTKKQAEFMKKFLTHDTDERIVNIQILLLHFSLKKKNLFYLCILKLRQVSKFII